MFFPGNQDPNMKTGSRSGGASSLKNTGYLLALIPDFTSSLFTPELPVNRNGETAAKWWCHRRCGPVTVMKHTWSWEKDLFFFYNLLRDSGVCLSVTSWQKIIRWNVKGLRHLHSNYLTFDISVSVVSSQQHKQIVGLIVGSLWIIVILRNCK